MHFILSGSVLGIWTHMEAVFGRHTAQGYKMQIVRVQTMEGKKLVGEEHTHGRLMKLQWNFSTEDTTETQLVLLYREVSLLQR